MILLLAAAAAAPASFADALFAAGEFEAARIEYLREALSAEADPRSVYRVAECLWAENRPEEAGRWLARWPDDPVAALGVVEGAWRAGDDRSAIDGAAALLTHPRVGELARWRRAWARLRYGQQADAVAAFAEVGGALEGRAAALIATLGAQGRPKRRSPTAAGAMSAVLPGAGQAWSGEWADALSALGTTALLTWGTIELARRDEVPGAVAVGVVDASFWAGNVLAAVDGARAYNRRDDALRWDELADFDCVIVLVPEPDCVPPSR